MEPPQRVYFQRTTGFTSRDRPERMRDGRRPRPAVHGVSGATRAFPSSRWRGEMGCADSTADGPLPQSPLRSATDVGHVVFQVIQEVVDLADDPHYVPVVYLFFQRLHQLIRLPSVTPLQVPQLGQPPVVRIRPALVSSSTGAVTASARIRAACSLAISASVRALSTPRDAAARARSACSTAAAALAE